MYNFSTNLDDIMESATTLHPNAPTFPVLHRASIRIWHRCRTSFRQPRGRHCAIVFRLNLTRLGRRLMMTFVGCIVPFVDYYFGWKRSEWSPCSDLIPIATFFDHVLYFKLGCITVDNDWVLCWMLSLFPLV